jgi:hypothetical protein
MEFPRLTPSGDRLPSGRRLFRRPEELTDEQFDLLAVAWADDALSGDSLAETEEAMASSPARRVRAESFRQIRLSPLNDRWEGRNRMLKSAPGAYAIRRTLIVTLTVAAALGAMVILGPLLTRPDSPPAGPAVAEAQNMGETGTAAPPRTMSEALIPEASPVITSLPAEVINSATRDAKQFEDAANPPVREAGRRMSAFASADNREPAYSLAVTHDFAGAVPILAAGPEASRLAPVELRNIIPLPVAEREENWIVRGLSLLAEAITKEPKNVDGYFIADACIRGANRVLGWDMALEQARNDEGEQLATNFSSSLLSFSAPVKKTHP